MAVSGPETKSLNAWAKVFHNPREQVIQYGEQLRTWGLGSDWPGSATWASQSAPVSLSFFMCSNKPASGSCESSQGDSTLYSPWCLPHWRKRSNHQLRSKAMHAPEDAKGRPWPNTPTDVPWILPIGLRSSRVPLCLPGIVKSMRNIWKID